GRYRRPARDLGPTQGLVHLARETQRFGSRLRFLLALPFDFGPLLIGKRHHWRCWHAGLQTGNAVLRIRPRLSPQRRRASRRATAPPRAIPEQRTRRPTTVLNAASASPAGLPARPGRRRGTSRRPPADGRARGCAWPRRKGA